MSGTDFDISNYSTEELVNIIGLGGVLPLTNGKIVEKIQEMKDQFEEKFDGNGASGVFDAYGGIRDDDKFIIKVNELLASQPDVIENDEKIFGFSFNPGYLVDGNASSDEKDRQTKKKNIVTDWGNWSTSIYSKEFRMELNKLMMENIAFAEYIGNKINDPIVDNDYATALGKAEKARDEYIFFFDQIAHRLREYKKEEYSTDYYEEEEENEKSLLEGDFMDDNEKIMATNNFAMPIWDRTTFKGTKPAMPKDYINPLLRGIMTKTINIDSQFRTIADPVVCIRCPDTLQYYEGGTSVIDELSVVASNNDGKILIVGTSGKKLKKLDIKNPDKSSDDGAISSTWTEITFDDSVSDINKEWKDITMNYSGNYIAVCNKKHIWYSTQSGNDDTWEKGHVSYLTDVDLSNSDISGNWTAITSDFTGKILYATREPEQLRFSIQGTDASYFQVDEITGEVKLKDNPDYEIKPSYSFIAAATVNHTTYFKTVLISVYNVSDLAPKITSGSIGNTLDNGSETNQTIYTINVTSQDSGSYSFSYAISGTDADLLTLDGNTVTLNTSPNYSTKSSYSFVVTVTNNDSGANESQSVSFFITNPESDNNAPVISGETNGTNVDENSDANKLVYTIVASSGDNSTSSDEDLTYEILGPDTEFLTLGTGDDSNKVYLNVVPDYETKSSYSFVVRVTDPGNGESQVKKVTFSINDLTERILPPTINSSSLGTNITFSSLDATPLVYTITATADGETTQGAVYFSYEILGQDAKFLTLGSGTDSNKVYLNVVPDYETKSSYSFVVRVTDNNNNKFSEKTIMFLVRDDINNINITSVSSNSITENAGENQTVYTIKATYTTSDRQSIFKNGGICYSDDYAATWKDLSNSQITLSDGTNNYNFDLSQNWKDIEITGDGEKVYGIYETNNKYYIVKSINKGMNWQIINNSKWDYTTNTELCDYKWEEIVTNFYGTKIFIRTEDQIWRSFDSGTNWSKITEITGEWNSITCSLDGLKVAVWDNTTNSLIFSENGGSVWNNPAKVLGFDITEKSNIVISADGDRILGLDYIGNIFTSKRCVEKDLSLFDRPSNFTINLSEPIKNVVSISIKNIEIPHTWDVFSKSEGTNVFYVKKTDGDIITITIPEGSYHYNDTFGAGVNLIKVLNTALVANNISDLVFSYRGSNNIVVTNNSNPTVSMTIWWHREESNEVCGPAGQGTRVNYNLGWLLGFRKTLLGLGSEAEVAPAKLNLRGTKYVYISLDEFSNNKAPDSLIVYENNAATFNMPSYFVKTTMQPDVFSGKVDETNKCYVKSDPQPGNCGKKRRNPDSIDNLTSAQRYTIQNIRNALSVPKKKQYKSPIISNHLATVQLRFNTTASPSTQYTTERRVEASFKKDREYFGPITLRKFKIRLLNERGNEIDMNENNWSFALIVDQLYNN